MTLPTHVRSHEIPGGSIHVQDTEDGFDIILKKNIVDTRPPCRDKTGEDPNEGQTFYRISWTQLALTAMLIEPVPISVGEHIEETFGPFE